MATGCLIRRRFLFTGLAVACRRTAVPITSGSAVFDALAQKRMPRIDCADLRGRWAILYSRWRHGAAGGKQMEELLQDLLSDAELKEILASAKLTPEMLEAMAQDMKGW